MKRIRITLAAALVVGMLAASTPSGAFTNGYPDSMAAIGDSITQAANLDGSTLGSSNPRHSWSTGYDSGDIIISHYERLLARNANISGRNYNDAVSGAKMDDAPGQADIVVSRGVEYVTFLMGGNDVCTSSKTTLTPVATFEAHARDAMARLANGLPNAKIYLLSVPDVYQLYNLFKGNSTARWVWRNFKICQAMLSESNTEADRQFVRQRNIDFNTALARVCAEFAQCKWDGNATFNYQFTANDVSKVDYFHPSKTGQKNLAQQSWLAGYWPTS